jgi:hypothetical protein
MDATQKDIAHMLRSDPNVTFGFDCCSEKTISFHYIKAPLMYEIHDYLYHCPFPIKEYYYQQFKQDWHYYDPIYRAHAKIDSDKLKAYQP